MVDLNRSRAALDELREAGRCLALESYTASGFHTLRGLEVVMAAYFKAVSGKKGFPRFQRGPSLKVAP
jgi:hypothetical protein